MTHPSFHVHQDTARFEHLVEGSRPWWRNPRLVLLNTWIAILLITSSTNGYDASMMNGLQSLTQWEVAFNHPTGGRLGLLSAIQNIGSLAAYPFAPYITDGMGRKQSIILGAALMLFGASLQTAAQSVEMFIGARFLIGFGLTFAANSAPLLILEISYPTLRGPLTSLYNTLWFAGSITYVIFKLSIIICSPSVLSAAWSTYGTFHLSSSWSWRIPSALQGIPSLIQLILIWWLPESPRYLVSKGRRAEALQTLAYYHANGNDEDPLVEYEFEEIKAALLVERVVSSNVGWKSLFKTKGNRRRMRVIIAIAFFSQWSGNGLLSYYLAKVLTFVGIVHPQDQLLISGFLNIFNFLWAVTAGMLCDRVGRRKLFLTSTSTMLTFWALLTVALSLYSQNNNEVAAYVFVAFIFLYTSGYAIAYTPLIVSYTLEILPFHLRARGFAVFNFSISLSVIFNQYINPILLEKLGWKYYLVYVCWLVFELVFVYLYIIETKGLTLEETAALFDGSDTVAEISFRAGVHAGIDSHTTNLGSWKSAEAYHLSSTPRSGETMPSPLGKKRRDSSHTSGNFPEMLHVLEVERPLQVHIPASQAPTTTRPNVNPIQ
ncbi:general substrate transporter [Ramaria rubella]|nr:general substrate transporter [Ramaria rubella]